MGRKVKKETKGDGNLSGTHHYSSGGGKIILFHMQHNVGRETTKGEIQLPVQPREGGKKNHRPKVQIENQFKESPLSKNVTVRKKEENRADKPQIRPATISVRISNRILLRGGKGQGGNT